MHSTGGTGEGFYIGGNDGVPIASRCVLALNHVHDTGGFQGDGIEVKQGSWGNWIVENTVHDTPYPCILVYGTGGRARNVIERNVCWNSGDNVMQVQGEALVRNNALFDGAIAFLARYVPAPARIEGWERNERGLPERALREALLNALKRRYDYVLLDGPAVLTTNHPSLIGSIVDGILLVVRIGTTPKGMVEEAYQMLEGLGGNVLGTCATAIDGPVT